MNTTAETTLPGSDPAGSTDAVPDHVPVAFPEGPALPQLRTRVGRLLDQFLAEPAGESREILQLYLVTHLAGTEGHHEERALAEAAERRREAEAARREAGDLRQERSVLSEERQRMAAQVTEARTLQRALRQEVEIIQAAVQAKTVTQEDIVRRISAAIGMGAGLVERIEPGYQETPD